MKPATTKQEIDHIISLLIKHGFADRFNFSSLRTLDQGDIAVDFAGLEDLSVALRERPYAETYLELLKRSQFNVKMADGALIQIMYLFDSKGALLKHRLCFMPSPFNDEYQNEPEIYLEDKIYAEVVDRRILPVTMRFDYDPASAVDIHHPCSHFTLGQYKNCRIAACSPLTPSVFMEFIMRSFYHTAHIDTTELFSLRLTTFPKTITANEKVRLHLAIG